jgi:probable DNA metabolism protein
MSWLAIYDGSFPGLLCLAEEALGPAGAPSSVGTDVATQLTLFDEPRQVVTEPTRATAFWRCLSQRLSRNALRNLATVHLHGAGGHELAVIGYLRLGWERGHDLDACLTDPDVAEVQRRVGQVRLESHRLKGLVRFRRLRDGGYYAPLRPDHRVLYAVARHFARRLHNETWLLHDTGRGEALHWDRRELREFALPAGFAAEAANSADDEVATQDLWRMFHRTIAVPGRENARVQRQFMPRRYWAYLTEAVGKTNP